MSKYILGYLAETNYLCRKGIEVPGMAHRWPDEKAKLDVPFCEEAWSQEPPPDCREVVTTRMVLAYLRGLGVDVSAASEDDIAILIFCGMRNAGKYDPGGDPEIMLDDAY